VQNRVVLLVGMFAGILMGIEQDFQLAPAHANLNLIGSILLFLFGLYCRLIPGRRDLDAGRGSGLAAWRSWISVATAVTFAALSMA
jgi:hypothetical protein